MSNRVKQFCTIPIFIPELACPHQCVFCNQQHISGEHTIPTPEQVPKIIDKYLSTTHASTNVTVAFFGGSFTGIPKQSQQDYLQAVQPYILQNKISGIKVSTRPDYINTEIITMLQKYGVISIELGAQSFDNEVLQLSGRGHSVEDLSKAALLIKKAGIELGLQMMIGLPGDTFEKSMYTAQKIVENGADTTRIYPTLVIKDTPLEQLYLQGKFTPLEIDESLQWSKKIYAYFLQKKITVLRVGLHPSEEFSRGNLLAGPYHPSYKELVLSEVWNDIFTSNLPQTKGKLHIEVSNEVINFAVGYNGKNKKMLKEKYGWIKITPVKTLKGNNFNAYYS